MHRLVECGCGKVRVGVELEEETACAAASHHDQCTSDLQVDIVTIADKKEYFLFPCSWYIDTEQHVEMWRSLILGATSGTGERRAWLTALDVVPLVESCRGMHESA